MSKIIVKYNVADVEDFVTIEEGLHKFQITKVEEKAGAKGPYLSICLKCLSEDFKNALVFDNITLSEDARPAQIKMKSLLEFSGINKKTKKNATAFETDDLIGCVVVGEILHEDYNGNAQARLKNYYSLEELESDDGSDDEDFQADDIDDEKKKKADAKKAKADKKKAKEKAKETEADDDDWD